jgi:pimeloyl-ACP methyl ester carboxylesterase
LEKIASRSHRGSPGSAQQSLPRVSVAPGIEIAYRVDDYCDPWSRPDAVILLHGIAETGDAFKAWAPHFARKYRVIRPDLRGFGESTLVDEHAQLSLAELSDDIAALIDALQLGRVHLIGAKLGAQIGLELAQRRPAWLASMTLAGVLISPGKAIGQWVDQWIHLVDEGGVVNWARATMPGRMGGSLPPEAMEWWIRYMGSAPASTVKACFRMLPRLAEPARLENISCPTMVIVAVEPGRAGQFNQQQPVAEVQRWVSRIPNSKIVELAADSYHVAASHPDECAEIASQFLASHV